jgi:hypothetical protein
MRYFWLAFLLLIGLNGPAYAATGISAPIDLSVTIWSSDGATLAGGSGGNLITIAGTWTFGSPAVAGNYPIQLNGVNQGGPAAAILYILNSGTLYQQTATNVWWSWVGAGPWMGPVPDPRMGAGGCLAGSICPSGNWTIAFDEEFNGPLDFTSKWTQPAGGGQGIGRGGDAINNSASLSVSGGQLHIFAQSGKGGEISTPNGYGPGYYEARLQADPNNWDVFWTIANTDTNCQPLSAGAELDILEQPGGDDAQEHVHYSGYGACHTALSNNGLPSASDAFHLWGVWWDPPNGYTFYRDGVQMWFVAGPVSATNLSSIVITGQAFPSTTTGYHVDWVRYYRPSTVSVAAGAHAAGLQR